MVAKRLRISLWLAFGAVGIAACNLVTGAGDLVVGDGAEGGTMSTTSGATTSASTTSTTSSTTSTSSSSSSSSTTTTSTDPWEADRQACIDHMNALRAGKGLPPYQRWLAAEPCVDQQATHDQSVQTPHDAFSHGTPACGGNGQNECPGWGVGTITGCLDQMWAEGTQPGCAGCDACDTFTIFQNACPNCSFYGPPVCGHYVNMTSTNFTQAACGFSADGTWAAINFQ